MWADEPVRSAADDRLARVGFADRVADIIGAAGGGSTVFGLVGPWGSGKTSLLNMVRGRLPQPWQVKDFSPWAASDLPSLLAEFFAVIASAVPGTGAKRARNAVLACARLSVPVLGGVPYVGGALKGAASKAVERLADEGSWAERFRTASEQIAQLNLRVLVVVDDVDRLHADELATLLKAIRLLGRFPGVHYLLAYDETTVLDVLRTSAVAGNDERRALTFLEKIVQVPLPVPPAQRAQLDALVDEGVATLVRDSGIQLSHADTQRFAHVYQTVMSRTLTTVRAVRRYFVQASVYLPLIGPDEVDFVDFLLITYLRLQFPHLHRRLPEWKDDLLGHSTSPFHLQPSSTPVDWEPRIRSCGVADELVAPVKDALESLFPAVAGKDTSVAAMLARRAHRRRANTAEYFDRYFALGVPVDDIADAVVRTALVEALGGGGANWDAVREGALDPQSTVPRRLRIVAKLAALSTDLSEADTGKVARIAARLAGEAADGAAFIGSERQTCLSWMAMQLERLPAGSEPADSLLADLVREAGNLALVLRAVALARPGSAESGSIRAEMATLAAGDALSAALANLRARDEAPVESVITMLEFSREFGPAGKTSDAITHALQAGEFTVEDVAARFVSVAIDPDTGEPSSIVGFEEELLLSLVPGAITRAAASYTAADDIDVNDLSWANRRAVARSRLALAARQ